MREVVKSKSFFWLHYFNVHLTRIQWGFIIFLGKYHIIVKYIYSISQCFVRLRNFIKTSDTKTGLAYSLLYYDIINLLNCKPDHIFIVYSQRPHYIQSYVMFWAVCVKRISLNMVTDLISYAYFIHWKFYQLLRDYAATLVWFS